MFWTERIERLKKEAREASEVARSLEAQARINNYVAEIWAKCKEQLATAEHEFHSEKEKLGIELAKIKAEIEARKNEYATLLIEKDSTILTLKNVIDKLTRKGE